MNKQSILEFLIKAIITIAGIAILFILVIAIPPSSKYKEAEEEGYEKGYEAGTWDGYYEGYDEGYKDGVDECEEYIKESMADKFICNIDFDLLTDSQQDMIFNAVYEAEKHVEFY